MPSKKSIEYKQYTLKAYWFSRAQNAQECAGSLIDFLRDLENLGNPFIRWDYFNKQDKLEPIPSDVDEIRKQLLLPGNGSRRGVKPEATMPIMGFNVLLFSAGNNGERVTLDMTYGVSDEKGWNQCCIDLPIQGEIATQVLQPKILERLLAVTIKAWKPDWAVINYFDYSDPDSSIDRIPVYWFVYLSEQRGQIPTLCNPAVVGHIEGYGSYVVTTPEPFARDRPDHIVIANQVRATLGRSGLLAARSN